MEGERGSERRGSGEEREGERENKLKRKELIKLQTSSSPLTKSFRSRTFGNDIL
jgi:hypothetical protein